MASGTTGRKRAGNPSNRKQAVKPLDRKPLDRKPPDRKPPGNCPGIAAWKLGRDVAAIRNIMSGDI